MIAYRQGTLPESERDAIQEHLSLCPRCVGLLRELRDFETAAESGADEGPEPLREEAWASLVRRLPAEPPVLRPVTPLPRPRASALLYAAIAALLVAAIGLAILLQVERRRLADLERQLVAREEALSNLQRSLADAGRQLDQSRGRGSAREAELEARVAELTEEIEGMRRTSEAPRERIALAEVEASLAPRFILRGQESPGSLLRGGGEANRLKMQNGRVSFALNVPDSHPEVRFELVDRTGRVVWSARRPAESVLGDDGTSVTLAGLAPGRYRLRIDSGAEYILDVEPQ
jgi:hypothetical protein